MKMYVHMFFTKKAFYISFATAAFTTLKQWTQFLSSASDLYSATNL